MTFVTSIRSVTQRAHGQIFAGILLLFAFCLHSCDEELPVYEEPDARLEATITGEYWLSDVEHSLRIYVNITNRYEETLDGFADLNGSIVLFFPKDTTIRKTLPLTRSNLVAGTVNSSGTLKIDPNETIVLKAIWDFSGNRIIDDFGRRITGDSLDVFFFSFVKDPDCPYRFFARPEDLVLQGSVNVFSKRAPVTVGPTIFRFCYVSTFVPVYQCQRVITQVPCSNWP